MFGHVRRECFFKSAQDLELISSLASSNSKVHVEATKNIGRVGLAVEQSPGLVLALLKN